MNFDPSLVHNQVLLRQCQEALCLAQIPAEGIQEMGAMQPQVQTVGQDLKLH
jgi:hypothetical protein